MTDKMYVTVGRDGVVTFDDTPPANGAYASGSSEGIGFPEVAFGNLIAASLFDASDETVGSWWYTPQHGWRHIPYRQPRPWKTHTPGRYRQRRR